LDKLPRSQLEKILLYESLEQNYGLPTVSNQELIGATFARGEIAEILETEEGHAILMMEMLAFTYKKKPYEYRLTYGLTDERKLFKAY
jgi:DNA-binding GntR family transcriptional regulator